MSYEKIEKLASAVGEEKTLRMVFLFSGEHVHVPDNKALRRAVRNRRMLEEHLKNAPTGELAERYGLSQGYIYRLLRKLKKGDENGDG